MAFTYDLRRQVSLIGETTETACEFAMMHLQSYATGGAVEVLISSTGGPLAPPISLAEHMETLRRTVTVRTIATGFVASAAILPLVAGSKGQRYMMANASLMVHESSHSFDKVHKTLSDWEKWLRGRRHLQDRCWAMLARNSRKDLAFWKGLEGKEDLFLSPKEALSYGLVDTVLEDMPPVLQLPKV